MRRWLCLVFVLSACGIDIADDELDIVEQGTPADAPALLIAPTTLRASRLLVDKAGTPWLAWQPPTDDDLNGTLSDPSEAFMNIRLTRLALDGTGSPTTYQLLQASTFSPAPGQSICSFPYFPDHDEVRLSLRTLDDTDVHEFAVPYGRGPAKSFCGQRTLAYYFEDKGSDRIDLLRRGDDGKVTYRRLPWPHDADPMLAQGPFGFDDQEQVLFFVDADYHTLAFYLDSPNVVDLGVLYWGDARNGRFISIDLDGFLYSYDIAKRDDQSVGFRLGPNGQIVGIHQRADLRRELVTCDWDGLRAILLPEPGEPPRPVAVQRVLDPEPCSASGSQLPDLPSLVVYTPANGSPDQEVRGVRLDRDTPPRVLTRGSPPQIYAFCEDRTVAYSLDSPDRYGQGVGDGWMGRYRFMERGREPRFSPDCNRLSFKEHSADVRKLGELRSVAVPADNADPDSMPPPLRLGRNAAFNRITPDGRILAAVDLAVIGPQNRVLVIDDLRGEAQALVRGVNAVTGALFVGSLLPDRREVLLEVRDTDPGRVTGLLLLTLPPRQPAP